MKKLSSFVLAFAMLAALLPTGTRALAADTVWQSSKSVSFPGGSRTVTAVYINTSDKTLMVDAVFAGGQIGSTASLSAMAETKNTGGRQVVAAINGTFFDAYVKSGPKLPFGTIESGGRLVYANDAPTFAFSSAAGPMISYACPKITGRVYNTGNDGQKTLEWKNETVNSLYSKDQGHAVFTTAYGKTTGPHNMTSYVVRNGVITEKIQGEAPIYADGYTIVTNYAWNISDIYKVGCRIDMEIKSYDRGGNPLGDDWDSAETMLGVGPTLVRGGNIIADPAAEGFSEGKIATGAGQRSFIGYTKDKILVMGTVPNVTIKQLAQVAQSMGLTDAMNLDGGASSGLYYNGKYVTSPGRDLSNCLVVTRGAAPAPPPDNGAVPSSWAKAEIDAAIARGLVPAELQSRYRDNITRLDFCHLLGQAIEVKTSRSLRELSDSYASPQAPLTFSDTMDESVGYLSRMAIVSGYPDGRFGPSDQIERQQAAKILAVTAAAVNGSSTSGFAPAFADNSNIAAWALPFVGYVSSSGIMKGLDGNRFDPTGKYTREQSVITVLRLLG